MARRSHHGRRDDPVDLLRGTAALGLRRVVWASSETTLGLSFADEAPRYAPVDEDFGMVPYEAFLSGTPVITTRDSGGQ